MRRRPLAPILFLQPSLAVQAPHAAPAARGVNTGHRRERASSSSSPASGAVTYSISTASSSSCVEWDSVRPAPSIMPHDAAGRLTLAAMEHTPPSTFPLDGLAPFSGPAARRSCVIAAQDASVPTSACTGAAEHSLFCATQAAAEVLKGPEARGVSRGREGLLYLAA